jgi:hypothetical protein
MTQAEFSELANVVLEAFASEDGPGSIYTTDTPGANLTFIGSFYDTSLIGNVNEVISGTGVYVSGSTGYTSTSILYDVSRDYTGAAVYESATTSTASISIIAKQFFQDLNTPTGTEPPKVAFLNLSNTAPIKLGIDALVDEIHQYLIDSEGPGSYILRSEVPNDGIWQNLGAIDDVFSSTVTNSNKFLFKKLYSTGDIPRVNRPLKFNGDGTLQRLNDIELSRFAKKIREKIVNTGIGTYRLAPTAPATGTWLNVGSVRDTRQRIAGTQSVSYSLDYTGATNTFVSSSYSGTNYGGTGIYNNANSSYVNDIGVFSAPGIAAVYESSTLFSTTQYITNELEYQGKFADIIYENIGTDYTAVTSSYSNVNYVNLELYESRDISEYVLSYVETYGGEPRYINVSSDVYAGYVLAYTSVYTGPILYTAAGVSYASYTADPLTYSGPGSYTNPPATYTLESYTRNFYEGDVELSYEDSLPLYLGELYTLATVYVGASTSYQDNSTSSYTGGISYSDENIYNSGISSYASVSAFSTTTNYTTTYSLDNAYLSAEKDYLVGEFSSTLIFNEDPNSYNLAIYSTETYVRDPEASLYTGPGSYTDVADNVYSIEDSEVYSSIEEYSGLETQYTLSYETATPYTVGIDYVGASTSLYLGSVIENYQLSYSTVLTYTLSTEYLESTPYTLEPVYDTLYTGPTLTYTEEVGVAYAIFLQPLTYTGGDTVYVQEMVTPSEYYERNDDIYNAAVNTYTSPLSYISFITETLFSNAYSISYVGPGQYLNSVPSPATYMGEGTEEYYVTIYQDGYVGTFTRLYNTEDGGVYTQINPYYTGILGEYLLSSEYTGPSVDIFYSEQYTANELLYGGQLQYYNATYTTGAQYIKEIVYFLSEYINTFNQEYILSYEGPAIPAPAGPLTSFSAALYSEQYTNIFSGLPGYTAPEMYESVNFASTPTYTLGFAGPQDDEYLSEPEFYAQDFNRTYTTQYENIYTTVDYTGDEYALDIYTIEVPYTIDLLYDTSTGYVRDVGYGNPQYSTLNVDKNLYIGTGTVEYTREDLYAIDVVYTGLITYTGPTSSYTISADFYTGTIIKPTSYDVFGDLRSYVNATPLTSYTGSAPTAYDSFTPLYYTGPGAVYYTGDGTFNAVYDRILGFTNTLYNEEPIYTVAINYSLVINYTNDSVPDATDYSGPGFDTFAGAELLYSGEVFFIGPIQYTLTNEYTLGILYTSDTTFIPYTGLVVYYTSTELNYSTDYNAFYTTLLADYAGYNLSVFLSIPEPTLYTDVSYVTSYTALQYTQDKYDTTLEYSGQVIYTVADPEYTNTYTTSVEYVGPTGVIYTGDIEYTATVDFVADSYTGSEIDYINTTTFNESYTVSEAYNLLVNYTGNVDIVPTYTSEVAANEAVINNDVIDATEYILWRRIA